MPRSVTVRLRTGVNHAVLPDGRSMKAATNYVISFDDFQKISGAARLKAIEVVAGGISDAAGARNPNVDLTYNAGTLPTGFKIGATDEGVQENDRFILVKNVGGAAAAGDVLLYTDTTKREVTITHTADTADQFAGVALNAIGAGNFAWIQNDGEVSAVNLSGAVSSTIGEGAPIAVHPTVNARARVAETGDTVVGTLLGDATTDVGGAGAGAVALTPAKGRAPRLVRNRSRVI